MPKERYVIICPDDKFSEYIDLLNSIGIKIGREMKAIGMIEVYLSDEELIKIKKLSPVLEDFVKI